MLCGNGAIFCVTPTPLSTRIGRSFKSWDKISIRAEGCNALSVRLALALHEHKHHSFIYEHKHMKHSYETYLCYSMLQRVYDLWSCLLRQMVDVDHLNTLDTLSMVHGTSLVFMTWTKTAPQVIVILETTIFLILL